MKPDDFDFMGETKLMGYGESDSSGAWIKLQVLPDDLETFRGLKGEVFETALRNVDRVTHKEPEKVEKGPYGNHARDLILSGFFNSGKVREFFGGDEAYQAWCRTQPCAVTGKFNHDTDTGIDYTEYAHVRRAGEAGTAYKPKYSGVPLLMAVHKDQHHMGESACLHNWGIDVEDGPSWFDKAAAKHLKMWMVECLKGEFGDLDSLTKLSPSEFYKWADFKHLDHEIPNKLTAKYGGEYY